MQEQYKSSEIKTIKTMAARRAYKEKYGEPSQVKAKLIHNQIGDKRVQWLELANR